MIKKIKFFIVSICITIFCFSLFSACSPNEFAIVKESAELGRFTVTAGGEEIETSKGGIVLSVNPSPDSGCETISVSVSAGENEVSVMKSGTNRYSFTMPESDVCITVVFQYIPDKYTPNDSIVAQQGYQSAELLLYPDGMFNYTYTTTGSLNGATLMTKRIYMGTFEQKNSMVKLNCSEQDFTYSFTHPRAEVAKAAYEQFVADNNDQLTSTLPNANTAYSIGKSEEVFEFIISEDVNSFGLKAE